MEDKILSKILKYFPSSSEENSFVIFSNYIGIFLISKDEHKK